MLGCMRAESCTDSFAAHIFLAASASGVCTCKHNLLIRLVSSITLVVRLQRIGIQKRCMHLPIPFLIKTIGGSRCERWPYNSRPPLILGYSMQHSSPLGSSSTVRYGTRDKTRWRGEERRSYTAAEL